MDPRKLFFDDRLRGVCVYCGGSPNTRDHVPSRVLLDEPYPPNLPVADCCETCNTGFSLDEQYVACFIDCVIAGSTSPGEVERPKVARMLTDTPSLAARIATTEQRSAEGQQTWQPEMSRVNNVVLKLARGHAAYELGELHQLDDPEAILCVPLANLDERTIEQFLSPQETPFWPEVGSRAFVRACKEFTGADHWQIVQPGRYQYLVTQVNGLTVRILLSEYLACEVRWS